MPMLTSALKPHVSRFGLINTERLGDDPVLEAVLENAASLAEVCETLNAAYRRGNPIVSDEVYDSVFIASLAAQFPDHPYLNAVEPEPVVRGARLVRHEKPLLSTAKGYDQAAVDRYLAQVMRAAEDAGKDPAALRFRVTPKLDGLAVHDSGERLVKRGDGLQGEEVTHLLDIGVVVEGGRGMGPGELVCDKAFFHRHLGKGTAFDQEHARNFVAGLVSADSVKPHHSLALSAGAVRLIPFASLPGALVTADELREGWNALYDKVTEGVAYEVDGIVVEVADAELREQMGATSHHHRAVIALKRVSDVAETTVEDIRLTTGRTGRIVPTLLINPVVLSGATVSKVTAHTAKNLLDKGIGPGAVISCTRAGEVIPFLQAVNVPSDAPLAVTNCPACGAEAVEDGEHMVCPATATCPAQAEARLRHFFHTMGNVDLFGKSTISRLVDAGITELPEVYAMRAPDFERLGFGPGQSSNLETQLARSLHEPVMDWRFLASFGIRHLGRGDARKLLAEVPLDDLGTITGERIAAISGFGPKTSPAIADALRKLWPTITRMRRYGFTLESTTPVPGDAATETGQGPLAGEKVVFTGKMLQGKRQDMEAHAVTLGAEVQSGVNAATTLLVIGEKAGSKLKKAEQINEKAGKEVARILTEAEYLTRLEQKSAAS